MKVTLERATLLKSLGHVHRVVERRNTIPILSNVLLRAEGQSLTLKATDLDLEVTEIVAAEVGTKGATTLPAHILHDIVRKFPDGAQVSLETDRRQRASWCCAPAARASTCSRCRRPTFPISPPAR